MWRVFVVGVWSVSLVSVLSGSLSSRVHIMRRVDRTGPGVVCVQTGGSVPQFQRGVNVRLLTCLFHYSIFEKTGFMEACYNGGTGCGGLT